VKLVRLSVARRTEEMRACRLARCVVSPNAGGELWNGDSAERQDSRPHRRSSSGSGHRLRPAATPALAAAPAPTPQPGEPFYMKAIDHEKAKRGGTLRLAAHGPPSMFDIYASGTIANVAPSRPCTTCWCGRIRGTQSCHRPQLGHELDHLLRRDDLHLQPAEGRQVPRWDGLLSRRREGDLRPDRLPPANLLSLRILPIKETVVLDRHTVQMKLSEPRDSYTFLALLAGGWNVITSKKALDQHKGDLKQVDNFPGTGPFMYKSRTTESWEMVRNPTTGTPMRPTSTASSTSG